MWAGHVQISLAKGSRGWTWQQEAERKTRYEIYGCVERGHDVRGLELMGVNDWLCLTLTGAAQRISQRKRIIF